AGRRIMRRHSISRNQKAVLHAAAAGALASTLGSSLATASPLINIQILGKDITRGDSSFHSAVTVNNTAGDTVVYEVLAYLSPIGTTNNGDDNGPITINTKNAGTDGINSLNFDIFELASAQ